ncbi:hypothetical protein [Olivibacter domesticus]|uniref:Uncharacterized protein n=1 Tax=Olivibacter domesticus TaxID=407022 RepID=A0A1H7GP72_OLID1|nr:hypothetical protein [Olivibacter domesticus]SEK39956.1 hypothetical protein SAMN05661044_00150 [Olivibacter domesticus]
MNKDSNLTMIDRPRMLNAFYSFHIDDYKPTEVVKEFWKKYSCLKAARNVYEIFHILNGRDAESFDSKEQLHIFLDDLMAMFVSEYYVQLNGAVPKIPYRPKS